MTEETRKSDAVQAKPPKAASVNFSDGQGATIEIYPDSRLPEYDSGPVKAYRARDTGGGSVSYFALICEKQLVPRVTAAAHYRNIVSTNLLTLAAHGVVNWTPARQERYVFLYAIPGGTRAQKLGDPMALAWRQDIVMESFVKPMAALLKEFKEVNFFHHGIRPSNLFVQSVGGKIQNVMLGDCLSLPPSYGQSVLYEPIERSMADPVARGDGTSADDLYSFGVTLAVLLRNADPMQGLSDHDIIREKIAYGSYSSITGKDRFKGSILELLRGLLQDDAKERWTIEEVMTWLDGRRLSPKQALKHKKAARPMPFGERRIIYAPLLAFELESNLAETARIVDEGDLTQWLERSLDDEDITERVVGAIQMSKEKGTGPGYEERLACNLSIALDGLAPIRYKKARLMGDGIGDAMVEAAYLKQDLSRFVDLFSQGLGFNWLTSSKNSSLDNGALISRFDQCRNFIRHGKAGYGVERCIYLLSPDSPCLSEKLRDFFVRTPEDMIRAFEDMCQKGEAPAMFLDRHTMAFLSVKDSKVLDPYLFDLASGEDHRRIMGNLCCLGAIQKRSSMPAFPGIAKVFADAMPAIYARYHDREVRVRLESSVKKIAQEGDLARMAALLSNTDVTNKDQRAFREAMQEYAQLVREHTNLEYRLQDKGTFGKTTGKEFAAITSSILAAIIILVTTLMFFTKMASY